MRIWFAVLTTALVSACTIGLGGGGEETPEGGESPGTGEVTLHLPEVSGGGGAKTVTNAPYVAYRISATGPEGHVVEPRRVTGTTRLEQLQPGEWNFSAVGLDANDSAVGEAQAVAQVAAGASLEIDLLLQEYVLTGDLIIIVNWGEGIADPRVAGVVGEIPLTFAVSAEQRTARAEQIDLQPGWYTVIFTLRDGEVQVDGETVAVLIERGRATMLVR